MEITSQQPLRYSGSEGAWWSLSLPFVATLPPLSSSPQLMSSVSWLAMILTLLTACTLLMHWAAPGGPAWGRTKAPATIPGPRGWPLIGSLLDMGGLAHVRLAELAQSCAATTLMALSLGETRVILTCVPEVAREILASSAFANRPIKRSARELLFDRAMGFAPYGSYWRNLRRIAATHLFAPRRMAAHEGSRQRQAGLMLDAVARAMDAAGVVAVRPFLQHASVNNIMGSVFGRTYSFDACDDEARRLQAMIREGFDLLGAFNWSDHLPWLGFLDAQRISQRSSALVIQVKQFVQKIIDEHRQVPAAERQVTESDFVDVLLSLDESEKLCDADMIAVLWEMIFRGTDTTAILMEWVLAELVLHPEVQARAQQEIDNVAGDGGAAIAEADLVRLPYLQAVIKETLRMHPPGPLLSWARLAIEDVHVAGYRVPAGTTAMVNMWAITHDPAVWEEPGRFRPERFLARDGGADVDIRGGDLRLAPFGAGRRVCPGRALGHITVQLWAARLLQRFDWAAHPDYPVDLSEVLKLSCEMQHPLRVRAIPRHPPASREYQQTSQS